MPNMKQMIPTIYPKRYTLFSVLSILVLILVVNVYKNNLHYSQSVNLYRTIPLLNVQNDPLNNGFRDLIKGKATNYKNKQAVNMYKKINGIHVFQIPESNVSTHLVDKKVIIKEKTMLESGLDTIQKFIGLNSDMNDGHEEADPCLEALKANYTVMNGVFLDKDTSIQVLPKDFNFTINPITMCFSYDPKTKHKTVKDIFIISMIHTAPNNFDNRDAIRETWGSITKYFNYNIRLIFMLGLTDNETIQNHINNESKVHGDIVQANFQDAYSNLTYKMSMGYKWISYYCPHAEFILKIDDDIYVDMFKVIYTLNNFKLKYGPFLRDHIDDLRPRSKLFPYIYNQSVSKWIDDYSYIIPGREFETRLKKEASKWALGNHSLINRHTPSLTGHSDPSYDCYSKRYTMQEIDPSIKSEYETIFGVKSHISDADTIQLRDILICVVMISSSVIRDNGSKWYVPENEYIGQSYEPYCSGWAMILTPPLAYKLYKAYFTQPYLFVDDAHVTGKLARIAGAIMINIDYTVHNRMEDLDKWVKDDQLSFINSNTTNPWKVSSQFKYVFCYSGENRANMLDNWNKTLQGHTQDQSFILKKKK